MKDLTNAWIEWHTTCELDKCSEQNITDLCNCSNSMFARAKKILPENVYSLIEIPNYSDDENAHPTPASIQYAKRYTFHLMESYCLPMGDKAERQQFKDNIFARADEPGKVTGYFLRDFFRSFVRRKENISYSAPQKPSNSNDEEWEEKMVRRQAELSPWYSPETSGADNAIYDEINSHTQKYWSSLDETEKAALYSYLNNITISTPELLEQVGCKKSVFSQLPHKLIANLNTEISKSMPQENDRISYLKTFLRLLPLSFEQWEQESELGQWICEHFPFTESGRKRHFSQNLSGKKDF